MGLPQATSKHGGDSNPLDTKGLCLLSLDGGGVRGLSTLYILKSIMDRLNNELEKDSLCPAKPCEVFDLIGGTSTGGLIAIMLGRLKMSVDECIAAYSDLASAVFGENLNRISVDFEDEVKPQFVSARLESEIRKIVTQHGASEKDPLYDGMDPLHDGTDPLNDGNKRGCRIFVCSMDRDISKMVRLRSYRLRDEQSIRTTICQAALATTAATTFFDPVSIGDRTFAYGGFGANNPVEEVEGEAANIWCPETRELKPLVKCFISIGTGNPGTKAFEDSMLKFLSETVVQIATETEATEKKFIARWAKYFDEKRYFRFNVEQGLQNIGLEEYKKKGAIEAASEDYLTHTDRKLRVRDCVQNLKLKQSMATANLLNLIEEYNEQRKIGRRIDDLKLQYDDRHAALEASLKQFIATYKGSEQERKRFQQQHEAELADLNAKRIVLNEFEASLNKQQRGINDGFATSSSTITLRVMPYPAPKPPERPRSMVISQRKHGLNPGGSTANLQSPKPEAPPHLLRQGASVISRNVNRPPRPHAASNVVTPALSPTSISVSVSVPAPLFVYIRFGGSQSLKQLNVRYCRSDGEFFSMLRHATQQEMGVVQSWYYQLRKVEFAEFYMDDLLHIRNLGSGRDASIPNGSSLDWEYCPRPMHIVPPVGSQALLDYVKNPSKAKEHATPLLEKIPKARIGVEEMLNGGQQVVWGLDIE